MGDQHGHGRAAIGSHGRAGVETEPTHPQHTRAGHGQGQVVRGHGHAAKPLARSNNDRRDQCGGRRGDMHHGAPGEILQAQFTQPAAAPDPVANRRIHQHHPQGAEQQHGGKAHALREGADDQRRGDNGKGHLENGEQGGGYRAVNGVHADTGEEHVAKVAYPPALLHAVAAEGKGIADGEPHQRHQASEGKTLHQHRQHILGTHQAGVEQGQARDGHEQHQRGGGEYPGGIAPIDFLGARGRRYQHRGYRQQP